MPAWELGHRSTHWICFCRPGLRPNQHILSCWNQLEVFPLKCQKNGKRQGPWPTKDFVETNAPSFKFLWQFIDVNISSLRGPCSWGFRECQERVAGISPLCQRQKDRDFQMGNDSGSESLLRTGAQQPSLGSETSHSKLITPNDVLL